jgi:hypothetical protein
MIDPNTTDNGIIIEFWSFFFFFFFVREKRFLKNSKKPKIGFNQTVRNHNK